MAMMLTERSHNTDGLFGWWNYERRNWIAVVVAGSIGAFMLGNGWTTTSVVDAKDVTIAQKTAQVEHKTAQLASALSVAGCQQKRAEVAESMVEIGAAGGEGLPDCPPVSTVVPKKGIAVAR